MTTPCSPAQEGASLPRFVWGSFLLITLFGWLVKLPILQSPIKNPDSVIYLDLARGLLDGRGYTLQGSSLLEGLPASLYDHPIFNHPPGFPLLLVPLVYLGIPQAGILISWLGQTLCALAVVLLGREMLVRAEEKSVAKIIYLIALIGVTLDPILSFCSRRVWMDNVVAGFVAMGFAGVLVYLQRREGLKWLVLAGLSMAAAVGTKLIAAIFLPLLAVMILVRRRPMEWKALLVLLVPSALVVLAWEITFFRATGVWFPHWFAIGNDLLKDNPFVAHQVGTSPWYLWTSLLEIAPLTLLILPVALWEGGRWRKGEVLILLGGALLYLVTLTVLGMKGVSKEARYLSVAMPLWYMLLLNLRVISGRCPLFLLCVALAVLAGAMLSGVYFFALAYDEPLSAFSLMEMLRATR